MASWSICGRCGTRFDPRKQSQQQRTAQGGDQSAHHDAPSEGLIHAGGQIGSHVGGLRGGVVGLLVGMGIATAVGAAEKQCPSCGNKFILSAKPAEISKVTCDAAFSRLGKLGISITTDVTLRGWKGQQIHLAALFFFDNGTPLNDLNGCCGSTDGQVLVMAERSPEQTLDEWRGANLFLPSDELHLLWGQRYQLKYRLTVSVHRGGSEWEEIARTIDSAFVWGV